MFQKLGILIALAGLASLTVCAVYAAVHPRPIHLPLWAGIGSTWSMAIGTLMLAISLHRSWRQETIARLITDIHG